MINVFLLFIYSELRIILMDFVKHIGIYKSNTNTSAEVIMFVLYIQY